LRWWTVQEPAGSVIMKRGKSAESRPTPTTVLELEAAAKAIVKRLKQGESPAKPTTCRCDGRWLPPLPGSYASGPLESLPPASQRKSPVHAPSAGILDPNPPPDLSTDGRADPHVRIRAHVWDRKPGGVFVSLYCAMLLSMGGTQARREEQLHTYATASARVRCLAPAMERIRVFFLSFFLSHARAPAPGGAFLSLAQTIKSIHYPIPRQ
jgi:hypothetical protein